MYVWIPRYKYQLFNVGTEGVEKQIINIEFERGTNSTGDIECTYKNLNNGTIEEKCLNKEGTEARNGEWYTHPAFTFKGITEITGTELPGIWVGKFEVSDPAHENGLGFNENSEITILPGKTSVIGNVRAEFLSTQKISEDNNKYNLDSKEVDTHLTKNIEWGAVSYLTQSIYGIYKNKNECNIEGMGFEECEVWINNTSQSTSDQEYYRGTYTGCVGATVSAAPEYNTEEGTPAKCDATNVWNKKGVNASTTGNTYGIYDMSGGFREHVMGVVVGSDGKIAYNSNSGFNDNIPNSKYYDLYEYDTSSISYQRGHLGDATREILTVVGNSLKSWNSDSSSFPTYIGPWISRGGSYSTTSGAGIFAFSYWSGWGSSFRSVLTAA